MLRPFRASVAALCALGCGAVFPEISPPMKAPPPGRELTPPPPEDLYFIVFVRADIPSRTRDGRQWDSLGGSLPDPFAQVFVNDREIIKTPIQSDTLNPTWPNQTAANYPIANGSHVRVEIWDSNPINNHPICVKGMHELRDLVGLVPVDLECEGGAHVRLRLEPAHAMWGLGFLYELKTTGVDITRVIAASPAGRAGLKPGDELVEIEGKRVATMEEGDAQSLINANAQTGITLTVRSGDKDVHEVKVKEGVVYPTIADGVPVQ
jgi:hypothetical protein